MRPFPPADIPQSWESARCAFRPGTVGEQLTSVGATKKLYFWESKCVLA
jgi:hypothetical protein